VPQWDNKEEMPPATLPFFVSQYSMV